ncbi:MAG: hypothetical protein O2841_02250 [Actinomycetota bacterium]|nr:hypothetical protein [Actinomycetota bacterium]
MTTNLIHLRRSGVSVVLDVSAGVPVIAHWGRELESVDEELILAQVYPPKQPGNTKPMCECCDCRALTQIANIVFQLLPRISRQVTMLANSQVNNLKSMV